MKSIKISGLLLASLLLTNCGEVPNSSSNESELINKHTSTIVGGSKIESYDRDRRRSVLIRGTKKNLFSIEFSICTGAFIDTDIVLTAAHCFDKADFEYSVVYADDLSHVDEGTQVSQIKKVIIHPEYRSQTKPKDRLAADIALVQIHGPKPEFIDIQTLATKEEIEGIKGSFSGVALGYGATHGQKNRSDSTGSGRLRKTTIKGELNSSYSTNFHVVNQTNGQGVCQGDSGGPGFVLVNGVYKIFGIVRGVFLKNGNIHEAQKQDQNLDICRNHAYYLSTAFYYDWIIENKP